MRWQSILKILSNTRVHPLQTISLLLIIFFPQTIPILALYHHFSKYILKRIVFVVSSRGRSRETFSFMHEYFIVFHSIDTYTHIFDIQYTCLYQLVNKTLEARLFYLLLSPPILLNYLWIYQLDICHDDDVLVVIVQERGRDDSRKKYSIFIFMTCQLIITLSFFFFCGRFFRRKIICVCFVWVWTKVVFMYQRQSLS